MKSPPLRSGTLRSGPVPSGWMAALALPVLLLAAMPAAAQAPHAIPVTLRGNWFAGSCEAPEAMLALTARSAARIGKEPSRLDRFTALRDIPGLVVGCPSRGDDAATMLRTLAALAKVDGRVSIFLEPIALYMTKDLHEAGDGEWLTTYPAPDEAMVLGEGRLYNADADDLVIFSYGNGVPMSLRAARSIEAKHGWKVRVVDLRWLVPLNEVFIAEQAKSAKRILIVDEGRHSAGVGEGVITAIAEAGFGGRPFQRVVGVDTYTPLAGAAFLVLPGDDDIVAAAGRLV